MEKLCVRAEISCGPRGNKGFGNLPSVSQQLCYVSIIVIIIVSNFSMLISLFFSNWEPVRRRNSWMLIAFFRSAC